MNSIVEKFAERVEQAGIQAYNKSSFYDVLERELSPIVDAINAGIDASTDYDKNAHISIDYCENAMFLLIVGHDEVYRDHIAEFNFELQLHKDYRSFAEGIADIRSLIDSYKNPKHVADVMTKLLFQETEHNFNKNGYVACLQKLGFADRAQKMMKLQK